MFHSKCGRCGIVWHSQLIWHFHGKILTFLRLPDPRFEEDCQDLQAPELAIAHPIGGFLECHCWCWNTKHLTQVDGRFLTWNAFPFSCRQVGLISNFEAFSSLEISASQFVKDFLSHKQFAQYDNDNANWMGMIPSNHFPLPYVFFPFLSWVVAVFLSLLPCFWNRNRKRAQPKALGQRTMATGHPIACLITVSRRMPDLQKRSALAIDGVLRWGGFGLRSKHL